MKSTYKILSAQLDGKPLAKDVQLKVHDHKYEKLFPVNAEFNLFDFPHCRRIQLASELLTNKLSVISNQMFLLETLEELIIEIDYHSPLLPVNTLFLKRVLQATGVLQQIRSDVTYTISVKMSDFDSIKTIYNHLQSLS